MATAGSASVAGCGGLVGGTGTKRSFDPPPVLQNRPNAVYYPTFSEGMTVVDVQKTQGYACTLAYTYPLRFWLIAGTHTTPVDASGAMHLMAVVWHVRTRQVVPDVGLTYHLKRHGKTFDVDSPWPMLAQPMGWHYGDNVEFPGEGEYDVTVHVGPPSAKRIGPLADAPSDLSFDFTLDYSESAVDSIPWQELPKRAGTRGAVPHANAEHVPTSAVPTKADLPGSPLGTGTSGDAEFVVTVLDDATRFGGTTRQSYLAVSPRSPYDRYLLPRMKLAAVIDGTAHSLAQTLDSELGPHYGSALDDDPGSAAVRVDTPPQIVRHEGYETAWIEMTAFSV